MTRKQTELFELIKREFFVNPSPPQPVTEYVSNIQAHLSVVIGNMFDWYVRGSGYTRLSAALHDQLDDMKQATINLAGKPNDSADTDDRSPLVLIRDQTTTGLQFVQQDFVDLRGALPVVDTDPLGTMRFNHHFLGELHPQGNIIALAASIVAAFLNENVVIPKVSPSVTTWEKEITTWMWQMLKGLQPAKGARAGKANEEKSEYHLQAEGGRIVAGGTIANLTALFIAREKFHEWCTKSGQNPSALKPVVLYSSHSHYSIKKAARVVGLVYDKDATRSNIVRVDGQNYWYVTADDMAKAIQAANARGQFVIMVSALAGATDTGFVDDLDGIAEVISEYNQSPNRVGPPIYYHIDAAMGGPFRLVSTLKWKDQEADFVSALPEQRGERFVAKGSTPKKLFDGIERGNAITIDGHKYFYCNYPCGGIFVREERDFKYLQEDARYLESGESEEEEPEQLQELYRNLHLEESPLRELELEGRDRRGLRRTLEGSRGIIGIMQLYCTLAVFGPEGIQALLQHTLDMTKELRKQFRATRSVMDRPAVELITSGPLNQTLFRVVTNWEKRTEPERIDRDNQINFLLPYYASWTQTGRLNEELKKKIEKLRKSGKLSLAKETDQMRKRLHPLPFYLGSDQLLDHIPEDEHERSKRIGAFLDYVWRINEPEESHCPVEHKQNIQKWLASVKDPQNPQKHERVLQVLKVVITHPFTDVSVISKFVKDLREAASVINQILVKGEGPIGEFLKKMDEPAREERGPR